MMKNITFSLLLLVSNIVSAQVFKISDHYPIKDGKIVFERIDSVSSNKALLFTSSKKWIVENFKSSKSTIQSEDVAQGQILGIGVLNIHKGILNYPVKFNYQINTKNQKYRFRIYNLTLLIFDSETKLDDLTKSESKSLSALKYAKSVEQAKDFCSYFMNILDSYNSSIINSSKDDF